MTRAKSGLLMFAVALFLARASWAVKGQEFRFDGTNGEGLVSGLVSDGAGNFYGTTTYNLGTHACGTVFKWSRNESGVLTESTIYTFLNQPDGCQPYGTLALDSAGNIYGTTDGGGTSQEGTVFELSPGTGGAWTEKVLYSFPPLPAGCAPQSGVTLDSSGNLYGTTTLGGIGINGIYGGTVFKLSSSGSGWTASTIYEFPLYTYGNNQANQTLPRTSLTFDTSGNLYGVTWAGGTSDWGTAFQLSPNQDGTWTENVLHNFTDGLDGGSPSGGLTFDSAGNLYGEAYAGGSFACPVYGCGLIFELTPEAGSWDFSVAYALNGLNGSRGEYPYGGVSIDGAGNIYGTTSGGGSVTCFGSAYACGTIFELTPTKFEVLASFDGTHGGNPGSGVILDAQGNLYGTTVEGGDLNCNAPYGCGVVFELTP